jgi:hypothetical protein
LALGAFFNPLLADRQALAQVGFRVMIEFFECSRGLAEPMSWQRGRFLTMVYGMMERLSNRKWRELLGRYIFGLQETE